VRRIAVAIEQPVEHGRPTDIADEAEVQAFFLGKAVLLRQDRQAGIDQRQETDNKFACGHVL
jgi:hypothetical protein